MWGSEFNYGGNIKIWGRVPSEDTCNLEAIAKMEKNAYGQGDLKPW